MKKSIRIRKWGGETMKNAIKKGYRIEKACEDELKKEGYRTWKTIRVQYQNIDLFGLFDVCALHPEGEHLKFIQCKSNRCDGKTRDAIAKLKMPKSCEKWIYIWKDRKYWIREKYD
jgi:hypothetical protein